MDSWIPVLVGLFVGKFIIAPIFTELLSEEVWLYRERLKERKRILKSRVYFRARAQHLREQITAATRSKILRDTETRRAQEVDILA